MGSQVITISITRATAAPTRAGFGTPIILAPFNRPELVLEYNDASEMLTDGFTSDDPAYKEAVTVKSQSPSPPLFKLGQIAAESMTATVSPTIDNAGNANVGDVVAVSVNGVEYSYEILTDDDAADIAAGLAAAISAAPNVTATGNPPDVDLTSASPYLRFTLEPVSYCTAQETTVTPDIADSIAAIRGIDDDWYGVCTTLRSKADLLSLAAAIEPLNRIASITTTDAEAWDNTVSTDVLSQMQDLGYVRTIPWVSNQPGAADGSGIEARMLTTTPGSATWAHKQLGGVAVSNFTEGQKTTIESKNGNYYRTIGGLNMTYQGITPGGEWIDVMRLVDWTEARIYEGVLQVLAANEKIPYTNPGIELIKAPIRAVLRQGVDNGGFVDDELLTVTAPDAASVSNVDKGNRLLPDVKFTARLAGAIHDVIIQGTVSL